jgi:hypothetical protein
MSLNSIVTVPAGSSPTPRLSPLPGPTALEVAQQRGSGNVAEAAAIAAPETSAENRHALRACRGLAVCLEAARSDARGRTGA